MDTVADFDVVRDTIQLDNSIFTALTKHGVLAAGSFRSGAGAIDANDRIIYNPLSGVLTYDANGNAAGGAVTFAVLDGGLALSQADFVIV